jgi:phosphoribosylformylglycinamidine synthase
LLSCHDISDGGLLTTIAEMLLGGNADGKIGAEININFSNLRNDKILFSESPGFVFEVENKNINRVKSILKKYNLDICNLGKTTKNDSLIIKNKNNKIIKLKINAMKKFWTTGFVDALK